MICTQKVRVQSQKDERKSTYRGFPFFQVGMTLCGIFTGIFVLKRAFTFSPWLPGWVVAQFFLQRVVEPTTYFCVPLEPEKPPILLLLSPTSHGKRLPIQLQAPDSLLHSTIQRPRPTTDTDNTIFHTRYPIRNRAPHSHERVETSPKKVDFDYKRGIWNLNRDFNTPTTQKKKQKNNTVPPQQDQDRQTKKSSRPRPRSIVFSAVVSRRSARFK